MNHLNVRTLTQHIVLVCLLTGGTMRADEPSDESVIELDPFSVTSEDSSGYRAADTLAGARMKTSFRETANSINVVTAEFLRDTTAALPSVPVTVVKKADALVIQFALATTTDKQEARNKELSDHLDLIGKAVAAAGGLRFESREVYLASGDRKKSIFGKGGVVTSFANFVIFAELTPDARPVARIKQVRELINSLHLDTSTTKLIDGPVGLYIRRPSQYRGEILAKAFDDLAVLKKGLGPEFEILPSGLNGTVRMRTCSESDIELWIDYSFTIRSVRELEVKAKS